MPYSPLKVNRLFEGIYCLKQVGRSFNGLHDFIYLKTFLMLVPCMDVTDLFNVFTFVLLLINKYARLHLMLIFYKCEKFLVYFISYT
jgi:hypothetical protein